MTLDTCCPEIETLLAASSLLFGPRKLGMCVADAGRRTASQDGKSVRGRHFVAASTGRRRSYD
jgi:hypothetical protein